MDLTGDGRPEVAVGSTQGASAGQKLVVMREEFGRLEPVLQTDYHRLEWGDWNGDGQIEVATWLHDTGPVYLIQIYRWSGQAFLRADHTVPAYFQEKVLPYYQAQLARSPDLARMLTYALADASNKAGDPRQALDYAAKALAAPGYPDEAVLLAVRGEAYYRAEDYAKAVADLDRVLAGLPPEREKELATGGPGGEFWMNVLYYRGLARLALGKKEQAATDLQRAVRISHGHPDWEFYRTAREKLQEIQALSRTASITGKGRMDDVTRQQESRTALGHIKWPANWLLTGHFWGDFERGGPMEHAFLSATAPFPSVRCSV